MRINPGIIFMNFKYFILHLLVYLYLYVYHHHVFTWEEQPLPHHPFPCFSDPANDPWNTSKTPIKKTLKNTLTLEMIFNILKNIFKKILENQFSNGILLDSIGLSHHLYVYWLILTNRIQIAIWWWYEQAFFVTWDKLLPAPIFISKKFFFNF